MSPIGASVRCLLPVVALVAACSNDLSALYAHGHAPRDAGGKDAGDAGAAMPTPLETALAIYGADAACVACVESHCQDLAQACAGDESCRQDAACRVGCAGNPDCEWDCKLAQSKTDRPTFPLEDCIIEGCVEKCRVGQQFDCVGRFGRPLPDAKEKIVEIWQPRSNLDASPIPKGVRARVCAARDLECATPEFETFSDADGTLRIEWPAPRTEFGSPVPFEGYLELVDAKHDPPRILPQLVVTNGPQRSNSVQWPNEVGVARPEDVPLYEALGDVTIDLGSSGIVSGGIYDCRASERLRGIGVTIEISPVLPETRYLYGFDSAARATGGGAMSGVFTATPVTPGFGTLIASYEGKEVGRAGPFPVRAGAITAVVLVPR